jgi:DtxR family Mn-dependent transcriptional regulator
VSDLIDTTEMYLRTILELEEEGVVPLRARIAERLHQSGPTVSQTVARMERDGLLHVSGDRQLQLSEAGRQRAVAVMRKHRLAELLLVNVIGLEYEIAHVEACRWEHVISDTVELKLYELLGKPTVSPYGNVIPGLDELDAAAPHDTAPEPMVTLASVQDASAVVVVRRISEKLQGETDVMEQLHEMGVEPGAKVTVSREGAIVNVMRDGRAVRIPRDLATLVFVTAS